jgi:hypothetical protein
MNVLVIPEDSRKDEHTLRPIIKAMAAAIERPGQPKLRVGICTDPILGGIGEVLKWDRIRGIIEQYPTVDLFLVCVDRDGLAGRRVSLDRLEKEATLMLPPGRIFLEIGIGERLELK